MFRNRIIEDRIMKVVRVSEKLESKARPSGLNTVNLLKVGNIGLLPIFIIDVFYSMLLGSFQK